MKKTKFISSLLSAILILSAVAVPVAAADVNQDSSGGTATVSYTNDSVWTATIPAYVAPVEAGQQDVSAYEVAVKDVVIGDNQQLAATVEYSGYVTEANGVKIPYQLYDSNGEEIQSGDTILSKSAGEPGTEATITFGAALTDSPKYAGVYTDTATFAFTAKDKVYTLDEINADEHLLPIGKTKPEYVVAKFNDDFSEVTIFANGESSDGQMMDFKLNATEPSITQHAATLKTATIKNGVKSIGAYAFANCTVLESAYLTNDITKAGASTFLWCSSLSTVNIPENLSTIPQYMFASCASLTNITFPPKTKTIEMRAFQACGLESLFIPSTVDTVSNASTFAKCNKLKTVTASNNSFGYSFSGTGRYEGAFANCTALETIDLSNYGDTKLPPNFANGCTALTHVELGDKIEDIYVGAFLGCTSLKSLTIPASVRSIGVGALSGYSPQVFDEALESLTCLGTGLSGRYSGVTNQTMGISGPDDKVIFYVPEEIASTWIAAWGTPEETADSWFPLVII